MNRGGRPYFKAVALQGAIFAIWLPLWPLGCPLAASLPPSPSFAFLLPPLSFYISLDNYSSGGGGAFEASVALRWPPPALQWPPLPPAAIAGIYTSSLSLPPPISLFLFSFPVLHAFHVGLPRHRAVLTRSYHGVQFRVGKP